MNACLLYVLLICVPLFVLGNLLSVLVIRECVTVSGVLNMPWVLPFYTRYSHNFASKKVFHLMTTVEFKLSEDRAIGAEGCA